MSIFRIRQTDICAATGYSKAYLSQVLAGDGFVASDRFWQRLNARLPDLIRDGAASVFEIKPVILDTGQEILMRRVDGSRGGR